MVIPGPCCNDDTAVRMNLVVNYGASQQLKRTWTHALNDEQGKSFENK
jgi:hypothetical protein